MTQTTPIRTLVDGNNDVFRYGLFKYQESQFEDPTYLGFTIELDDKSALFNDVLPFLEKHSETRAEMASRIPVYKEFVSKVKQIFNSQESIRDESDKGKFIKQHYINSVSGLDLLTKKFNKWREDKLTLELHEDIAMFSSYLTSLYNNLIYSFENGRVIIPENLLKFNMYIKISEIRNLTSIGGLISQEITGQQIAESLKNNITCLVYKLYDCEFDFFQSQPIQSSIIQSGIDAAPLAFSILSLDIYFKSVSRQIYNPLINNGLTMNDNKVDLDIKIISQNTNNSNSESITMDGQAQEDVISIYNQEAFVMQNQKKPSSKLTYDKEVSNGAVEEQLDMNEYYKQLSKIIDLNTQEMDSEIDGFQSLDVKNKDNEIKMIQEKNNQELDEDEEGFKTLRGNDRGNKLNEIENKNKKKSTASDNASLDVRNRDNDLKIIKIQNKELESDIEMVEESPGVFVRVLKNVGRRILGDSVSRLKRKGETLLMQKRNELITKFKNTLADELKLKPIYPDNVYTNPNYYMDLLGQLEGDIGSNIQSELNNVLKSKIKIPNTGGKLGKI